MEVRIEESYIVGVSWSHYHAVYQKTKKWYAQGQTSLSKGNGILSLLALWQRRRSFGKITVSTEFASLCSGRTKALLYKYRAHALWAWPQGRHDG
jgi:hypothetical protein